ncbi:MULTISPECIES: hypothetical protein [unclassified Pseudomonas]|uniref:hypothetical protein n=1 Tax=unclassified Pseudomonas TaxID=196821 RepID=UPI0034CF0D5E
MHDTGNFVGHAGQLCAPPCHQPAHGVRDQNYLLTIATVLAHQFVNALSQTTCGDFVGIQPVIPTRMHRHPITTARHQLIRHNRRQLTGQGGTQPWHADVYSGLETGDVSRPRFDGDGMQVLRPNIELRPPLGQELAIQGLFQPKKKRVIAGFADFAPAALLIAFSQGKHCAFFVRPRRRQDGAYRPFGHRAFSIDFHPLRV